MWRNLSTKLPLIVSKHHMPAQRARAALRLREGGNTHQLTGKLKIAIKMETTVYKSKVDAWLVILFVGGTSAVIVPFLVIAFSWIALLLMVAVVAATLVLIYGIRYTIAGEQLIVECSFVRSKFDIGSIKSIKPTRSVLSAPAASIDRIEIRLSNRKILIVSPKEKSRFVNQLLAINPSIDCSPVL